MAMLHLHTRKYSNTLICTRTHTFSFFSFARTGCSSGLRVEEMRCFIVCFDFSPFVLGPAPLTHAHTTCTHTTQVSAYLALVELEQTYLNSTDTPLEAVYSFPLHPNVSISSFRVLIDGRKLRGTAKKTEEAREAYQDAISSGQSAFLGVCISVYVCVCVCSVCMSV